MPLAAPASANKDHQELQRLLVRVQQLSGKTGTVAESLARPLHDHMEKEENLALPLLGILADLVEGKLTKSQALRASRLYSKMKEEYPGMLRGHKEITRQLSRLKKVGAEEGHLTAVRFAEALEQHAQQEEEVLYPAALLAGKLASVSDGKHARKPR
jgi:hemerythrin-like domain-containing protein